MIDPAGSPSVAALIRAPSSGAALLHNIAAGIRMGSQGPIPVTLPPVSPEALSGAPTGLVNDPTRPTVALPSFSPDNGGGTLDLLDFSFSAVRDRVEISNSAFGRLVGDYSREQFSLTAVRRGEDGTNTLLRVDFFHERLVARIGGAPEGGPGKGPVPPDAAGEAAKGPLAAALNNPLSALFEAFAPEKVAGRIANFAEGGYTRFRNGNADTEGLRGAFRDFIAPYIEKGYNEALGLLGDSIPGDIRDLLSKTKSLVDQRLSAFVSGGAAEAEPPERPSLAASAAPTSLVDLTA
ncbi:MAG: DUF5610 domain-containing protein [Planctomycetes bacterium]|nr:DUF5610 domain-containing protein [Planctomycetota bacterium]